MLTFLPSTAGPTDMIQQLLLTKRIFLEAAVYVDRSDPVSSGMAISVLQDCVELYVWTVIKARSITAKETASFVSNLEALQKANILIPEAAKLLELNKARVGFKHYGNLPATIEARKHQTYVEDFLRRGMQDDFGLKFDDLSLVDLVGNEDIRLQLRAAEVKIAAGNYVDAANDLAKAKTLAFGQMQKYLPRVSSGLSGGDKLLNMIEGVRNANSFAYLAEYLGTLREASLVAMLQLPLEDYTFLRNSLPNATQAVAGNWLLTTRRASYTEAECRRALVSIVNLCQKLELRS